MLNIIANFGAVGDGITDDTIAFQNAGISGKTVCIPSQSFKITNTITLNSNTIFAGEFGATLLNQSSNNLLEIVGNQVTLNKLNINTSSTGKDIVLRTDVNSLTNINISDINSLNTNGLISDIVSSNTVSNFLIENINTAAPLGITIDLNSFITKTSIDQINIDYTNSISPNFTAISIAKTGNLPGCVCLSNINILGNNSIICPNQNGIILGTYEGYLVNNCNILLMGGTGLWCKNTINAHINNVNSSFNIGNQMQFDSCTDSTITNCMARGRANGALSPLVLGTYGAQISGCSRMNFSNTNFKSNGAGVWQYNSSLINYSNCGFTINQYHGYLATGSNTSCIIGSVFSGNGLDHVYQLSPYQYVENCVNDSGILFNFNGAGSI